MYLLGSQEFLIATDHKPLIPIFNNPSEKLSPRLERLRMKTQHLDFVMIHITGKSNMTDYLSRHPLPRKDSELQTLIQTIGTGNWKSTGVDLKHYYDIRTEIYEADGVVLRGGRIIPPTRSSWHKQDEGNDPKQVLVSFYEHSNREYCTIMLQLPDSNKFDPYRTGVDDNHTTTTMGSR